MSMMVMMMIAMIIKTTTTATTVPAELESSVATGCVVEVKELTSMVALGFVGPVVSLEDSPELSTKITERGKNSGLCHSLFFFFFFM